ncbi:MarR family transcriptional regulator [Nocardia gamkensis]|uniref:MarR family winged helix-turn-helix transcriptional regulator n=1 Tax=Nocardia gamkensis TaxID=352869 RepID=UPI0033CDA614
MSDPVELIELETMIFGRYSTATRRRGEPVLDRSAYTLLSRIAAEAPMSITQLRVALGLDVSTLNRQTSAAMRAGHLRRIPDPDGGVARKFELTAEGRDRLEEQRRAYRRFLADILHDWDRSDLAVFAAYLRRFNSALEGRQGVAWPRPVADAGGS